ncbi:MAG: hypothetical protein CO029_00110 [Candidatus Magasanikbacteria bacterium CG_4_9_14_0_2_um_filter_41_10]|uniref:Glycosyltransferase RgtA/B/C/D-like domain-containing protein n=1 Tax=Candidatus Magasanikbacteria bacterium CG_4_10_14_0_2_um_filter_41_31 TaxID=1974639 RepID=A0A2M7V4P0_9BACT|nr:MAG: hypothetical protein AUJ37_00550 [Candidatus Magasanikbacteria bacterium CG1_02_41_34]PIZ93518.1 MAG: hypothetical protein COX83_01725 [Candidatus Magasanikbacteria bacterium CG_4_10_14_0_2_um_filter_41_31]PJC53951.1 MAG: hypothetical protein CO029_00110 [Candidatus Magasanikbacteria bacterium CG_4_9_14_0_2_um_filter_41_10]
MIRWKSQLITAGIGVVVTWFVYIQLFIWQMPLFGMFLSVAVLLYFTYLWRDICHHVFRFERGFVSWFLSAFAALFFLTSIESIALALYTTTVMVTFGSFVVAFVSSMLLRFFIERSQYGYTIVGKNVREEWVVFPRLPWLSWIYIGVWIVTLGLFFKAHGIAVFFSPWQSLSAAILPLIGVLSVLLGILISSKMLTKQVLVFIMMYSFLLHLYMPLSHVLPWGGDVWRHIGVEEQLAAGEIIPPVLFGPEARWREVAGIDIPEVLLIPQKYSYGQFWSLAVIVHQLTTISFETINIWMIPLLWSLIFPLILFRIGRLVLGSWRGGLFFAWLSCIAFPLQVLGALSLPVSLGVLTFFFILMLLLQYLAKPHASQRALLWLFGFLMLFGYALSFLLFLFVAVGAWLFGQIGSRVEHTSARWAGVVFLIIIGGLFFPVVELVARTSVLPTQLHIIELSKTILGQLSGWYYASAIRPHDVLSGNLIFNHTPTYAFVSSIFTAWRWWVVPFMISLWGVLLYALIVFAREKKTFVSLIPAWLLISLLGAYKIGWFLLAGDRTLIRRFDPYIATLVVLFFSFGLLSLFSLMRYTSIVFRRLIVGMCVLTLSWVGASTYASGPDMRSTSSEEYAVASFLADQSHLAPDDVCVLADTWVLLPLEGLTHGTIVGGNFPIDYQFGQEARVALYDIFIQEDITSETVQSLFDITKKAHCYLVLPNKLSEDRVEKISILLDTLPVAYPGFRIWDVRKPPLNLGAL